MCTDALKIGTHNGIFHPDEVVAIAIIALTQNDITVIRSRDDQKLQAADILVDVGCGKYDHHMPGGNGKRANGIPYASCGLVWRDYGEKLLEKYGTDKTLIQRCFKNIDARIICPIDQLDNGIDAQTPFSIIESFIPNWNEENVKFYSSFIEALKTSETLLEKIIKKEIASNQAENLINKLLEEKGDSFILEIPCQCFPWKNRIVNYNKFEHENGVVNFVVFPYPSGGYAAQCVPRNLSEKFSKRVPFPEEWAGQSHNLSNLTGVKTAKFCHNNCFFVRADTKEDVIKLCHIANLYNIGNNPTFF